MKQSIFFILIVLALLTASSMSGCTSFKSNQAIEHYNVGKTLQAESKYDEAIAEFNEAIKIDPVFTNAYISRGYTYILKEKYDLAIVDYTKAISLDPDNPIAFNGRGAAYLYTKQFNLALQDYYRSLEIKPGQEQIQKNVDYCKKMLGDADTVVTIDTGEWPAISDENVIGIYEAVITGNIDDNEGRLSYHVNPTILRAYGGRPDGKSGYFYKWSSPDNLAELGIYLDEDGEVGGITEGEDDAFPLYEGIWAFTVEVTDGRLTATGTMTLEVKRYDVSSKDGIPGVPGPWASLQQWPQEVVDKYPLPSAKAGHYYGVTLPILGGTPPYDFTPAQGFTVSEGEIIGETPGLYLQSDCGVLFGNIPVTLAGETIRFSITVTDGDGETDPYCPEYTIKVLP